MPAVTEIQPSLVAIVQPSQIEYTQRYLAHIRQEIRQAASHQERACLALIALTLEVELKRSVNGDK